MLPTAGSASLNSAMNSHKQRLRGKSRLSGLSFVGSKKKKDPNHRSNIDKLKATSLRKMPEEFQFNPKVSENFLESWLDFPVDQNFSVIFNSFRMWLIWLIWTNKSMAGLDPGDTSIRSRIVSQISVLGTAAGLFLVIAIAGFLVPPELHHEQDRVWIDVFGCLMFAASVSLIFYIGVALTAFYPLVESLRDDIAFDAFENYQIRVGGYEVYLFFVGMMFVTIALLVAGKILYSDTALYIMFGSMAIILGCVTHLSRQIFLALDPISSMHMGLSNDPEEHYRAELMSHFILRKIPNTITEECGEVFNKTTESKKLQVTRKSMAHITPLSYTEPPKVVVNAEGEYAPSGKKQEIDAQGSDVTLWQASPSPRSNRVAPATESAENMEVVDVEGEAHLQARAKPAPSSSTASTRSARATTPVRQYSTVDVADMSLKELFCGEAYVFKAQGLSSRDSVAAYEIIVRSGCSSALDLLTYLDGHKNYKVCNCGAEVERGPHDDQCSSRVAGVWVEGLTNIKIPAFHAVKIIQALKKDLK